MNDEVIASLRRATEAVPDDLALRLHLAATLLAAGRGDEAVAECATVIQRDPRDRRARDLMARALAAPPPPGQLIFDPLSSDPLSSDPPSSDPPPSDPPPPDPSSAGEPPPDDRGRAGAEFDWHAAENQVGDIAEPMFVGEAAEDPAPPAEAWDVERSTVTLADVGGLIEVKQRLEAAFLAPLRNPNLRQLYGKSLRGGLLLYGPPGCGKTFLARAVAGEMGARFLSVGLSDILDMWLGQSERNVHELFMLARRSAPVVLFLDEVDALGQKRSSSLSGAIRGTVNQLLTELDGVGHSNEGVFVLAATNQPWDVDPALRRPGRLDRTVLVMPPDGPAREAILAHHLRSRPVVGVDVRRLAKLTESYSGADLAHVCESAAERALLDSVQTGEARMITMADLDAAVREVRPSTRGWFEIARNVVAFGDTDNSYADLRAWMKRHRLL